MLGPRHQPLQLSKSDEHTHTNIIKQNIRHPPITASRAPIHEKSVSMGHSDIAFDVTRTHPDQVLVMQLYLPNV